MARSSVATDDFNRAGPALGANWTTMNASASGDIVISSSTVVNGSFARTYDNTSAARWTGAGTFTNDQYASVVIGGLAVQSTSYGIGVMCRGSGADGTRAYYGAYVVSDAASGGTQTTVLFKIVAGAATALNSGSASWANGDRVDLECEGTTIRLCKNGTPLGGAWTVTDSDISSGAPGVIGGGTTVATGDDWDAGSMGAGGGGAFIPIIGRGPGMALAGHSGLVG